MLSVHSLKYLNKTKLVRTFRSFESYPNVKIHRWHWKLSLICRYEQFTTFQRIQCVLETLRLKQK